MRVLQCNEMIHFVPPDWGRGGRSRGTRQVPGRTVHWLRANRKKKDGGQHQQQQPSRDSCLLTPNLGRYDATALKLTSLKSHPSFLLYRCCSRSISSYRRYWQSQGVAASQYRAVSSCFIRSVFFFFLFCLFFFFLFLISWYCAFILYVYMHICTKMHIFLKLTSIS